MNSLPNCSISNILSSRCSRKSDFWEPLAGELQFRADKAFMAYPGFAGVPADPSITSFEDLVVSAASRIDRPTALIAQSMGGVLAIETTIRRPSLITHLVLVATSGGLNTSKLGAVDWGECKAGLSGSPKLVYLLRFRPNRYAG